MPKLVWEEHVPGWGGDNQEASTVPHCAPKIPTPPPRIGQSKFRGVNPSHQTKPNLPTPFIIIYLPPTHYNYLKSWTLSKQKQASFRSLIGFSLKVYNSKDIM